MYAPRRPNTAMNGADTTGNSGDCNECACSIMDTEKAFDVWDSGRPLILGRSICKGPRVRWAMAFRAAISFTPESPL